MSCLPFACCNCINLLNTRFAITSLSIKARDNAALCDTLDDVVKVATFQIITHIQNHRQPYEDIVMQVMWASCWSRRAKLIYHCTCITGTEAGSKINFSVCCMRLESSFHQIEGGTMFEYLIHCLTHPW